MTRVGASLRAALLTMSLLSGSVARAAKQRPPEKVVTTLPPLPPAVFDGTLVIGGEDIAARKVRTRMTVAATVDAQGPFAFVVDSGADTSVLGSRVAQALKLPAGTPVLLHAMTSSGRVDRVRVGELGLGESVVRDMQLPVLREQDLGADGLIGIDALVEQRLMMDFEKRVIAIEDTRKPSPRLDGEIVVIARRRRGQLILTQATVNGKPVSAVIDTGSEITIGNPALRDRLLHRSNADRFKPVAVTGVTGVTMEMQIARVAELRVGPVILRNVPMAFAEVPPFALFGLSEEPALLLGTDFLEKFRRVALDFGARKVRFQLRRCKGSSVSIGSSTSMTRISLMDPSGDACRR